MRRFMLPPHLVVGFGVSTADDNVSVLTQTSTSSRIERRQKRVRVNVERNNTHFEEMCTLLGSVVSELAALSAESQADRTAEALAQEKKSVQFLIRLIEAAKHCIHATKGKRLEVALQHDPSNSRTSGIITRYLEDLEISLSKDEEELEATKKQLQDARRKVAELEAVVASHRGGEWRTSQTSKRRVKSHSTREEFSSAVPQAVHAEDFTNAHNEL